MATMEVEGGVLRLYLDDANEELYTVAVCKCGHGQCAVQRTMLPAKRKNGPRARGRPLGFLTAWLKAGSRPGMDHVKHMNVKLDRRERCEARQEFEGKEGAQEFLEMEREQRCNEETEPWNQP